MVLPPPWRERLSGVEVSEWELSADGSGARRLQGGEWAYFEVLPSGRVEPADAPEQAAGAAPPPVWRPACVVPVQVVGARGAVSPLCAGPLESGGGRPRSVGGGQVPNVGVSRARSYGGALIMLANRGAGFFFSYSLQGKW